MQTVMTTLAISRLRPQIMRREPFLRPVRSLPSMTRPPTTPMMPMASRILVTMRPIMNVLP